MTDASLPRTLPVDPETLGKLTAALAGSEEVSKYYYASLVLPIHPNSQLRHDEAKGNIASCFNTASAALGVALDHLSAWQDIIRGQNLPVYANFSMARPAYECALRVLWLLDPAVDPVGRIGRGFAAQLDSLKEMRKFQDATGIEDGNASAVYDRLLAAARQAGLVTVGSDGKERCSVPVPSMVDLFGKYDRFTKGISAAWIYRFLSGHSHGYEWAAVRGAEVLDGREDGADLSMVRVDPEELLFVANRTVSAVARAVTAHINYRTVVAP